MRLGPSVLTLVLASGLSAFFQSPSADNPPSDNQVPAEKEPGIPVIDKLTVDRCGSCHKQDEHQNLTRISWIRTTPEGWEEAIKRMVRLNGLSLSPEDARHILTYLSQDHGLAPQEAAQSRWYLEMRQVHTEAIPSPEVRIACASCHPFARPQSWRRSPTEWKLLVNMHLGYFPVSENNSFHARPRPDGYGVLPASTTTHSSQGQPTRYPVDDALDYLNKNNDLHSAAWSNWRASMSDPNLKGRWDISASSPGKGKYFGQMALSPGSSPNMFSYSADLVRVADGSSITLTGQSVIYTGYEWRGRAQAKGIGAVRQVMTVSPDQSTIEGRWFWGDYQEFGINIKARRASGDPVVLGTSLSSLHAGSQAVALKIIGDNFPASLHLSDVDLGPGVHVKSIVAIKPREISLIADVDEHVVSGFRGVSVKSRLTPDVYAIYDKIDYIKVSDESALARLGGRGHPKGYVQFEAIAFNRGLDGLPNTADDIDLGPIQVKWSIEEFISHYGDNDREFVGSIDNQGLFTPSVEGPNPQRKFTADNIGDVWVVASYKDKDSAAAALTAKSYLVVTVPLYMKWDEPEVAQ